MSNTAAVFDDRIQQMQAKTRVLMHGTQVLLGFQFAIMFSKAFDQLPETSKFAHMAALALITITVILLMTPAAVHRISFHGEDAERRLRVGSRFVVCAAVPLGLDIAADAYVAITRALGSASDGLLAAGATAIALAVLWFHPPLRRHDTVTRPEAGR